MDLLNQIPPCNLLRLLQNPLILDHVVPYLSSTSVLALASTSRPFRSLMYTTYPSIAFRRLDLTTLTSPLLHAQYNLTPALMAYRPNTNDMSVDDYYAAPLRRIFYVLKKQTVLECVTTLVLDGLMVPAALLREILCDEPFNVRILSLREVKNLGDEKLRQIFRYLIRPSRPSGSPKLKGVYLFTRRKHQSLPAPKIFDRQLLSRQAEGLTSSPGSQLGYSASTTDSPSASNNLNNTLDNMFRPGLRDDLKNNEAWAQLVLACRGIIAFDATICSHGPGSCSPPRLATIVLGPEGCQGCCSAPEGPLIYGQSLVEELPLLAPAPLFASTIRAAQSLTLAENARIYARCKECMEDRMCEVCQAWWCEDCYTPPRKNWLNPSQGGTKVQYGLCIQYCLRETFSSAGEGGMWG